MKNSFLKKILFELSEAFFPEGIKCICCGDELPCGMKYSLCGKCLEKLTFCDSGVCVKCGVHMGNMSDYCQACKYGERTFTSARGALLYSDEAARLVKDFKAGDKFLAPYLAGIMSDYYTGNLSNNKIDAACFVPIWKKRLKERGYNQSGELAKLLCEKTGLPLFDCLDAVKPIRKQATLTAAERALNVKGAYGIKKNFPEGQLKNKIIMLIDDVFTTGSTAGECASVLKSAGAKDVFVFTLATGKGR